MDLYWGLSSSWRQEDDTNVRTHAYKSQVNIQLHGFLYAYMPPGHKKAAPFHGAASSVELFTGYYFLSDFRSPDLPNREAMRSITFSFVNTNFRVRNTHFSTVFIVVSALIVRRRRYEARTQRQTVRQVGGGWGRLCAVISHAGAGKPRHKAEHIPARRRNKDIALSTPAAR